MTKPQSFRLKGKVNTLLFLIACSTPMPSCPRLDFYSFVNKQLLILYPCNSDNLTSKDSLKVDNLFNFLASMFPELLISNTCFPFHSFHFFQSYTSKLVITAAPPLKLLISAFPFTTAPQTSNLFGKVPFLQMFFHLIKIFQTLITILSLHLSNFSCLHFLLSIAQIPCSISKTFFMDYSFPYLVLPSVLLIKKKTQQFAELHHISSSCVCLSKRELKNK